MVDAWESSGAAPGLSELAQRWVAAPSGWSIAAWLWFAWWLFVGLLAVVAGINFAAGQMAAGAVCLIVAGFLSAQTLGWAVTSYFETRTQATLARTRVGDPAFSGAGWSTGARWWRRWHLFAAGVALLLGLATLNKQNHPAAPVAFLLWLALEVVVFIFFLIWLENRRRLRQTAEAAQLMDFTLWPRPTAAQMPELATWPGLLADFTVLTNGLTGQVGEWEVSVVEVFVAKGGGALGKRQQTLMLVRPALRLDFLLTPRDERDKINWVGIVFHLLHVVGWIFIAIELASKLFRKKETAPGLMDVPHGDTAFGQRYQLLGGERELILLVFREDVRTELLPKQWLRPPWHLHHVEGTALIGRPGERVEPKKIPEFVAEGLKLIALLQAAEADALALAAQAVDG